MVLFAKLATWFYYAARVEQQEGTKMGGLGRTEKVAFSVLLVPPPPRG